MNQSNAVPVGLLRALVLLFFESFHKNLMGSSLSVNSRVDRTFFLRVSLNITEADWVFFSLHQRECTNEIIQPCGPIFSSSPSAFGFTLKDAPETTSVGRLTILGSHWSHVRLGRQV